MIEATGHMSAVINKLDDCAVDNIHQSWNSQKTDILAFG